MQYIQAKTILSSVHDTYFGLSYNMNLYRGCQHGCIYCDSRSACYQMDDLSKIYIKENAIELLRKELPRKRKRGTIGFGSMNDPYMPIEKKLQLCRKALEIISHYKFPIHIITKSDLALRDLILISEIGKVYSAVTYSFSTTIDSVSSKSEPGASLPSSRLKALETFAKNGIYTGVAFMPVLPFINDNPKHVLQAIRDFANAGAQYILPCFGVTLREGSREFFYESLDKLNPAIKHKYQHHFGNSYNCNSLKAEELYKLVEKECKSLNIPLKMTFYKPDTNEQLSLF